MGRFRVVAAVVAFAAGMVVVLGGCARPVAGDGEYDFGVPGEVVSVTGDVGFYPACGNEILEWEGRAWFPFTPSNPDAFPDPTLDVLPTIKGWPSVGASVAMVVAPGPGDDVGTLVVYENDLAYWVADSGDLDTWLTNTKLSYNWVC